MNTLTALTPILLTGALALAVIASSEASNQTSSSQQTPTVIETTDTKASAQAWQLNDAEWQRYKEIQSGPRGIWSPGLDPITSLGIEAKTDADRRRYAELLVKIEKARVDKELAFQRAYDEAWKRLYPDLLPVASATTSSSAKAQPDSGRLLVFVSQDCQGCEKEVTRLLNSGTSFDLFMVGSEGDDTALRQWAQKNSIPPEKVHARQITLNHDSGQWLDLGGLGRTLPKVFKRMGEKWLPVER